MCIDDYQFRHYTALRPKQCRRFVFINEDDIEKTYLVNISQFQEEYSEVALCKIIFHLALKGLPILNRRFYWSKFNIAVEPGDYCKVPFSALSDKQIVFQSFVKPIDPDNPPVLPQCFYQMSAKMTSQMMSAMDQQIQQIEPLVYEGQIEPLCEHCTGSQMPNQQSMSEQKPNSNTVSIQQNASNQQEQQSDQHSKKRIKEPERLIGQVISSVKKWRKLYESKKLNLTKAAKLTGISKKSLDDYYLVLRIGQILGFDYGSNMNSKMGDLRSYIRTFDHKITGKLSKEVKCFDLVQDFDLDQIMDEEHERSASNQTDFQEQ